MGGRYILDGHVPVACSDAMEWGKFMGGKDNRRVAFTEIGDVRVSTVFLGIDHAWGGGPPVLFETMVFGGPLGDEQDRYCTWEDAEAGHAAMVERVRNWKPEVSE